MSEPYSRFNRTLLIVVAALFVITLAVFTYANIAAGGSLVPWWIHLVNALILSIPLVLFFGAIFVLVAAWRARTRTSGIGDRLAKIIHWAPRIAAIQIIFFVSLFSLDVFEMEGSPLELLGGFLIHSVPSIIMIFLLIFAWRRPAIGFVAFLLAGLMFLRFVIIGPDLAHFLLFSGPLLLISALFYADWKWIMPLKTNKASG